MLPVFFQIIKLHTGERACPWNPRAQIDRPSHQDNSLHPDSAGWKAVWHCQYWHHTWESFLGIHKLCHFINNGESLHRDGTAQKEGYSKIRYCFLFPWIRYYRHKPDNKQYHSIWKWVSQMGNQLIGDRRKRRRAACNTRHSRGRHDTGHNHPIYQRIKRAN